LALFLINQVVFFWLQSLVFQMGFSCVTHLYGIFSWPLFPRGVLSERGFMRFLGLMGNGGRSIYFLLIF